MFVWIGEYNLRLAAAIHTEGCPVQLYPGSIVHWLEHPSPLLVFPSSHVSFPYVIPSPQICLSVALI